MNKTYIDPPQGWLYGFPKLLPKEMVGVYGEELDDWLVEHNYPFEEIEKWKDGMPCKFITTQEEYE